MDTHYSTHNPARMTSLSSECLKLSAKKMNVLILGDSHAAHLDYGHLTKEGAIYLAQKVGAKVIGI